ncbi:MAG: hypothetical protein ACK5L3_14860 [Oscillospiraceae bacterium]
MVLVLGSACAPFKTALSAEEFTAKMQENKYEVVDYTEYMAGLVETGLLATGSTGITVEFYVTTDKEQAASAFQTNRQTFEDRKVENFSEKSTSGLNYKKYELTTGGSYMVICQVEETLVYVETAEAQKDEVQDILKNLGY